VYQIKKLIFLNIAVQKKQRLCYTVLEFDDIRHSAVGGLNSETDQTQIQSRVDQLFKDVEISTRQKLKEFYKRDFVLFQYNWNVLTNKLFE